MRTLKSESSFLSWFSVKEITVIVVSRPLLPGQASQCLWLRKARLSS